jgi:hypothetical protein
MVSAISRATAAILYRRGGGGGVLNPSIPPTAIVGRWLGGDPDANRTLTRRGGSVYDILGCWRCGVSNTNRNLTRLGGGGYDILACWRGGVPDTNRTLTRRGGSGRTVTASMAFCRGGIGVRSPHSTHCF